MVDFFCGNLILLSANSDALLPWTALSTSAEDRWSLEHRAGALEKTSIYIWAGSPINVTSRANIGTFYVLLAIRMSCRRLLQWQFRKKSLSLEPSKNDVVLGIRVQKFPRSTADCLKILEIQLFGRGWGTFAYSEIFQNFANVLRTIQKLQNTMKPLGLVLL